MINYKILDDSLQYYEENKFQRIETPWTVSKYVDELTKPIDKISFELKHNDKCLVASGEQSFLYLYLKDFIPKGQYQTITPCFRYEAFDFAHTKYFMKNELIKTDVISDNELVKLVEISLEFFESYLPDVYVQPTDIGFDIMWKNYELGSYGIRKNEFLEWIYGTGCAEPRLSKLIKLNENGLSYK